MSYLNSLYSTYKNNLENVGKIATKETKDGRTIEYMLLPVSHTTQTAHIEVTVNIDGTLQRAEVINKVSTIIPTTEDSASRSSNIEPYVLHDKLMYVAGDYCKYTGDNKKEEAFLKYIDQLNDWCESPYGHDYIKAIFKYLKKGQLIKDLVDWKVLHLKDDGTLLSKWKGNVEDKPEIFKVITGQQESAFVRFNIHIPGKITKPLWRNKEIFDSFINYYNTIQNEKDVCYVTGEVSPYSTKHPNKIRNSADKTKLISANDESGFTFRGRFKGSMETANICYDVSQKAHNALKWLIERQGKIIDGRVFLIWGSKNTDVPNATEELSEENIEEYTYKLLMGTLVEEKNEDDTKEVLARQYRETLQGKNKSLNVIQEKNQQIYVLTIDAATPGRLAVLYYRDYNIQEYLDKLKQWSRTVSWRQTYKKDNQWVKYISSPSFYTIAQCAYGPRPNEKVVKGVMERLLPCVLDGRKVPIDIIKSAIVRASNPQFYSNNWEWEQVLTVACSLVKKQYEREAYEVALDKTNKDRNYLFGRLLAVADVLERSALGKDENRATNALRYMSVFQSNPLRTWNTIYKSIQPYMMRLNSSNSIRRYVDLFDEIHGKFLDDEFSNAPLNGKYLLGYHCQREDLYKKKEERVEGESNE